MQEPVADESDWDLAEQLQDTINNPEQASMQVQEVESERKSSPKSGVTGLDPLGGTV